MTEEDMDDDEREMWERMKPGSVALLNGPELTAAGRKLLARGLVELVQLTDESILPGMYGVRLKTAGVVVRDWDAELHAIWKGRCEWREPEPHKEDEDPHGWSVALLHEGGFETAIRCCDDADDAEWTDEDAHRSRSFHPRIAALVDERNEGEPTP